jgi:hypothetical protein
MPRPVVAGLGSRLWSGPFFTVPAGSVTHSSEPMAAGRWKPEKSSLALGLNSTRTVSSRAVWVLGACLKDRGLLPVRAAIASSRPSCLAAGGKPAACLRSKALASAMTLALGVSVDRPRPWSSRPSCSRWLPSRSTLGATGL